MVRDVDGAWVTAQEMAKRSADRFLKLSLLLIGVAAKLLARLEG